MKLELLFKFDLSTSTKKLIKRVKRDYVNLEKEKIEII